MDTDLPHILVIDDDQKLRLLLKQFLENNGFLINLDIRLDREVRNDKYINL